MAETTTETQYRIQYQTQKRRRWMNVGGYFTDRELAQAELDRRAASPWLSSRPLAYRLVTREVTSTPWVPVSQPTPAGARPS